MFDVNPLLYLALHGVANDLLDRRPFVKNLFAFSPKVKVSAEFVVLRSW